MKAIEKGGLKAIEKGGMKAIEIAPVQGSLTCEVPLPPQRRPWDRCGLKRGSCLGAARCRVREKGRYALTVSD